MKIHIKCKGYWRRKQKLWFTKPIDITTSDVIQQYLLKNEDNYNSRKGKNQSIKIINKNISQNPNLSTISLNNISSLDMDKLKFYLLKK